MNNNFAFLFPGQGSQSKGMFKELGDKYPLVKDIFKQASDALRFDLWEMVQNDEEALNQTVNTQPALLTAGYAIWSLWLSQGGPRPHIMAGHSLGEYTALVCSEAINFEDGVKLVAERGRLMQLAVPKGVGSMAAIIGMDPLQVQEVCELASQNGESETVTPANFNAIGQIVISGDTAAVDRAVIIAKEKGAKLAKILPVSVPSHCELMKPASEGLLIPLNSTSFQAPRIPVINNVDVETPSHPDDIRDALVRQLYCPVRWVETIQTIAGEGITKTIESGPGKVLAGLSKRINKEVECSSINDIESFEEAMEKFN